ncbi:hypothetical protein PAJL_1005 [Cutibacterium acnes HL042PA3]|nr:hypothetical protein HMPREF9577_00716 [Cutibacterium acnes HL110PA3]ESK59000.1 hypothetical protein PAJL_1005 [Cutibacterium acnes HL042PA3]
MKVVVSVITPDCAPPRADAAHGTIIGRVMSFVCTGGSSLQHG